MEGLEHSIHLTPGIGGKPYRPYFCGLFNRVEYSTGWGEMQAWPTSAPLYSLHVLISINKRRWCVWQVLERMLYSYAPLWDCAIQFSRENENSRKLLRIVDGLRWLGKSRSRVAASIASLFYVQYSISEQAFQERVALSGVNNFRPQHGEGWCGILQSWGISPESWEIIVKGVSALAAGRKRKLPNLFCSENGDPLSQEKIMAGSMRIFCAARSCFLQKWGENHNFSCQIFSIQKNHHLRPRFLKISGIWEHHFSV